MPVVSRQFSVFSPHLSAACGHRLRQMGFVALLASCAWTATAQSPAGTAAHPTQSGKGKVLFSRSINENGQTVTQAGAEIREPAVTTVKAPTAGDAERTAVTFTDFDMDVRIRSTAQQLAVRALVTVRNDGKTPLARVPLQISSTLSWERIRANGRDVPFQVATLNSDADHTGQLHEAAITLAEPLAVGATEQFDVSYSGTIAQAAQRLLAIGTPEDMAAHSDWDQIGVQFTGLRGFGNVVWYPVASVPVILGDGARLFDQMGEQRMRQAGASFRLRLTVEFPHGQAPTVALINGRQTALTVTESGLLDQSQEVAGVARADTGPMTLGFDAPSLFFAIRNAHTATNTALWTVPADDGYVADWAKAAAAVTPFLQGWLGKVPRAQLTLLDLPDAEDAPFETGSLLVTTVRPAPPEQLDGILAHALTHAWMMSPRAWLSEGVAHFMGTLWVEKQRGRDKALESLEATRDALALAEPESPASGPGQTLAQAISPVFYRSKATYVLWMLRDLVGEQTLSAALRAYDPAADAGAVAGPAKAKGASQFEQLVEQAGMRHDLGWFFTDWVDADKGLPELLIEGAYPTSASAGNWLVAVNAANGGYAAVEVPITVRSATTSVTQRVRIPARGKVTERLLIQGKPLEVQLNDGTVPEVQAAMHVLRLDEAPEADPHSSSSNPPQL